MNIDQINRAISRLNPYDAGDKLKLRDLLKARRKLEKESKHD